MTRAAASQTATANRGRHQAGGGSLCPTRIRISTSLTAWTHHLPPAEPSLLSPPLRSPYLFPPTPCAFSSSVKSSASTPKTPLKKHTRPSEEQSRVQSCTRVHGCRQRRRWRRRGGGGGARRAEDGAALRRLRAEGQEGHQARAWCGVDRGGRGGEQGRRGGDGRRGGAQGAARGQDQEGRGDHLRRQRPQEARPRRGAQGRRRRGEEGGQGREPQGGEGEEATAGGEETQRGDGAAQDPPPLRRLRRPHQATNLQDQRGEGCGDRQQCQGRGEGQGHDGHPRHALLPQGEAQPRRGGRGARQEGRRRGQGRQEGQGRRRRQEQGRGPGRRRQEGQGQGHRGGGGGSVNGGRRGVHGGAGGAEHVPRGAAAGLRGVPAGPAATRRLRLLPAVPLLRQCRWHGSRSRQPQRRRHLLPPARGQPAAGVPAVPLPLRHGAGAAALQRREPQRLLRHVSRAH